MALSSLMKLTSSASFSPSIRISLRLKIHQAQAKNFCRVLDIRVTQIVETGLRAAYDLHNFLEGLVHGGSGQMVAQLIREHKAAVLPALAVAEPVLKLLVFHPAQSVHHKGWADYNNKCNTEKNK